MLILSLKPSCKKLPVAEFVFPLLAPAREWPSLGRAVTDDRVSTDRPMHCREYIWNKSPRPGTVITAQSITARISTLFNLINTRSRCCWWFSIKALTDLPLFGSDGILIGRLRTSSGWHMREHFSSRCSDKGLLVLISTYLDIQIAFCGLSSLWPADTTHQAAAAPVTMISVVPLQNFHKICPICIMTLWQAADILRKTELYHLFALIINSLRAILCHISRPWLPRSPGNFFGQLLAWRHWG